ncbi:MAG: cysteine hydrolase [Thermaerobacter sp.]|nr:cysteine hydrolase [Thermaerobacter sp.]
MTGRALVVVDMLRDFVEEGGALDCGPSAREILPRVAQELARARREGDLVIYLADHHRPDDPEFAMFPPHCIAGTRGAQVVDDLAPQAGEWLIPKRRYSGFFATQLDLVLREAGVRELTLTGVCSNICVLYTAADARNRGYAVRVVREGVASFDPEAHRFALGELERTLGATLV